MRTQGQEQNDWDRDTDQPEDYRTHTLYLKDAGSGYNRSRARNVPAGARAALRVSKAALFVTLEPKWLLAGMGRFPPLETA